MFTTCAHATLSLFTSVETEEFIFILFLTIFKWVQMLNYLNEILIKRENIVFKSNKNVFCTNNFYKK